MGFDRSAFVQAVADAVGHTVAAKLGDAWAAFSPKPEPDEGDPAAGRALAIALASVPARQAAQEIDALGLLGVLLRIESEEVYLNAREAMGHPLLQGWLCASFSDMIGEAISSGRLLMNAATNFPIFERFELNEHDARVHNATVFASITGRAPVQARVDYGAPHPVQCLRVNVLSGDAAWSVGARLRDVHGLTFTPTEPPEASGPASGAIH